MISCARCCGLGCRALRGSLPFRTSSGICDRRHHARGRPGQESGGLFHHGSRVRPPARPAAGAGPDVLSSAESWLHVRLRCFVRGEGPRPCTRRAASARPSPRALPRGAARRPSSDSPPDCAVPGGLSPILGTAQYEVPGYASTRMSTHGHLRRQAPTPEALGRPLRWLMPETARAFHTARGRRGHCWERRYRCRVEQWRGPGFE
jgi:hypothetical protein